MAVHLLLTAVMIFSAAVDIKKREIPIWVFLLLGSIALTGSMICEGHGLYQVAAGSVPGIVLLAMAKITDQSIGYGDGIVLAEIGCLTGAGRSMIILAGALALAGIFSLGMLTVKKVDKRYKIPFIPFLTVAYVAVFCIQAGQIR